MSLPPSFPARPCEDTPSSPPLVSLLPLFLFSVPVFFADTFRFSGVGVCVTFQQRLLPELQVIFLAGEAITAWAEEVSGLTEVLNVHSALLFSHCDPSSILLSALSDRFSLWTHVFSLTSPTFSPVIARTCLDERLSAFIVCNVAEPCVQCKHYGAGKLKTNIHMSLRILAI